MKTIIASIERNKKKFEIIVYAEEAINIRRGKSNNVRAALVYDKIFRDARKGDEASEEELKKVFNTTDVEKIALTIIREGNLPLPVEYLRKLREEKLKEIIDIIRKNAIDARTNLPIPEERIRNALEKVRFNVNPYEDASKQVNSLVKELNKVLPLKFSKVTLKFRIPSIYTSKIYGLIFKLGEVIKKEWLNDGSLEVIIEVPAGIKDEVISKVSSFCKGNVEVKEL